ncbi:MAG: response regulator transcription factor [Bdellovibrionales bacterium]|nr:response regulator transcription factor [Bdellovibrionales bacterium]
MSKQSILLVEDSPELCLLVSTILEPSYHFISSNSISDAKEKIKDNKFDLIILDIELTDGDGFSLCMWLKNQSKTTAIPIIFLTNRSSPYDKVLGFTLGAEDYIQKPIEPLEFKARVGARLRRNNDLNDSSTSIGFVAGPFRVELNMGKIYMKNVEGNESSLELTHKEYKLLVYFLQNRDRVLTRGQILDKVWDQTMNVTDRTVDSHVYTIRKKMGSYAHLIESIPKEGYMFKSSLGSL